MAKRQISGPFRVINIGVGGNVYEVVERINDRSHEELRPRETYLKRQSAYAQCARMNRRWQEDHLTDEPIEEIDIDAQMAADEEAYYASYAGQEANW